MAQIFHVPRPSPAYTDGIKVRIPQPDRQRHKNPAAAEAVVSKKEPLARELLPVLQHEILSRSRKSVTEQSQVTAFFFLDKFDRH